MQSTKAIVYEAIDETVVVTLDWAISIVNECASTEEALRRMVAVRAEAARRVTEAA